MQVLILISLLILGTVPLLILFFAENEKLILAVGTIGNGAACCIGLTAALGALITGETCSLKAVWSLPLGKVAIGLDPLSSFFLVCIFLVSGLSVLYGNGYFSYEIGKKKLKSPLIFSSLLTASMVGVVISRNGILFLMSWEIMSLSSFFLVTFENERREVRRAGILYLMASQAGALLLFVLFALLNRNSGSFNFNSFHISYAKMPRTADLCFLLALLGFGTKAGFWPIHIWLPEAHPAAPSPVSAVMSGVMIKMGIYGILRTLLFLGTPPLWWGGVVLGIGVVSGILGVLHALTEHDLKRLLAYHSVENIGIITIGIGLGLLGKALNNPVVTFLGYAGALLHVLNHGIFKGLLFHSAGSVIHAAGTRNMEELGGLYRFMPVTGSAFLVGSIAICGLPPFNGFISEWLLYMGGFIGSSHFFSTAGELLCLTAVPALALIGGLAVTCFVKAFGITFLGNPRVNIPVKIHESNHSMLIPMILGSFLCVLIGCWPLGILNIITPAAAVLGGGASGTASVLKTLARVPYFAALLFILILLFSLLRWKLLQNRDVRTASTWSCGYTTYHTRMQYTASSFAEPILTPFASLIHSQIRHGKKVDGYFPAEARYEKHLGDIAHQKWFLPSIRKAVGFLSQLRILQHGKVQLYLLYIGGAFVMLLIWLSIWGGH
jgi:hydrogenase-4 component B